MRFRTAWVLASFSGSLILLVGLLAVPEIAKSTINQEAVIISEIAWGGTADSPNDEWIELYNTSESAQDLTGWSLTDDNGLAISLTGTIPSNGFYILERSDDNTIVDLTANLIYIGTLLNTGATLILRDQNGVDVDSANSSGGPWPAGSGSPEFFSMERIGVAVADADENWQNNDGVHRNGLAAGYQPINGTPGQPNSAWYGAAELADLDVQKSGPPVAEAGRTIAYMLSVTNTGTLTATEVIMTDTLPAGFTFQAEDSQRDMTEPISGTFRWEIGSLSPGQGYRFFFTVTVGSMAGDRDNTLLASTVTSETNFANNNDIFTTFVFDSGAAVLIDALYYDGYENLDIDEAVCLFNTTDGPVNLSGWSISDGEETATFPPDSIVPAKGRIWISRDAHAFRRQFGFNPDFELDGTDETIPDLFGAWPRLSNDGDELTLSRPGGYVEDVVVFEDGLTETSGWQGKAVQPYAISGVFAADGQILFRKRDPHTGYPLPDSNRQTDWSQSPDDPLTGRRVMYPGWDLDRFFFPLRFTESAEIVVGITPDNALELIRNEIQAAQETIRIESLTFRSYAIAQTLQAAAGRGVSVTLLLEGEPVGGIDDQERLNCRLLETAGGQCWFMITDNDQVPDKNIFDRYRSLHAKFLLIDDRRVVISTENLSPDSFPDDDLSDGTSGRRGVVLATDAPTLVEGVLELWQADFDPGNHVDLTRWHETDPVYGNPPPGTEPVTVTGGLGYDVSFPDTRAFQGSFTFEMVQSPENSLRTVDGILGLINSLGEGDTLLVQQLEERPHWGSSSADYSTDPNLRLEAYIGAARRGAQVRLLLDRHFDDENNPTSNLATCRRVSNVASLEAIDLACRRANPTGLGIHSKIILVEKAGRGYAVVGSINGSEISHKGNREIAVIVQSDGLFQYLTDLFEHDWIDHIFLPLLFSRYATPADHLLISEVLYNPRMSDDAEFIELVNPTDRPIDLDGITLGDAVHRDDFEDVRRFPPEARVLPGETIVVAATATGFHSRFGLLPDFEVISSHPSVPTMIDVPSWGDPAAFLQLGNQGDEVLLRGPDGQIIDAIAYGSGSLDHFPSCPLVSSPGYSLERYPFWQDSDRCPYDFREWPFPSPGNLP